MHTVRPYPSARRLNTHYMIMQAGFWAMFSAVCGYQTALLLSRGFSNSQVGLVISVRCAAGILCQPAMGGFADRHPEIPLKLLLVFSLCISLCAGVFLLFPIGLAGTLAVFALIGGFEVSAYPFIDSMAIQYLNDGVPIRYSLGRGVGSLSYAVTAFLLGFLVRRCGVEATLPVHIGFVAAEAVIIALYPAFPYPQERESGGPRPRSVPSLLRDNPGFTLMLIAVFFAITGFIPMSNFLINIIRSRGGDASNLGPALFLMAASELPAGFLFPLLLRRFGSTRVMMAGLCFITLKAVLLLFAGNLIAVLAVQPVQMFGYGLFLPSSVYFVNESVSQADRVRGQTLLMVASNGLGGVFGNLLAGRVLDWGGVDAMLIFCICFGFTGILLGCLAGRNMHAADERDHT